MAPKTLRPYIKSSFKSVLHVDYNSNIDYKQILEELSNYLKNAGFAKKTKKEMKINSLEQKGKEEFTSNGRYFYIFLNKKKPSKHPGKINYK